MATKAKASGDKLQNGDLRPTGLYAKMAYVMGQVQHVPKLGHNTHFNYKYAREVDLTEHVRPLMAELGLLCIPSQTVDVEHVGEGKHHVMYVRHEMTWVDADTGDQHVQSLWGAGQDGQDKGPYKAITGALKYALMKTLLVPTGDDSEATDGEGNSTGPAPQRSSRRSRKPAPVEEEVAEEEEAEEEEEADEEPAPKKAKPAAKKSAPKGDEEALLERQIDGAKNGIRDALKALKEYELEPDMEENAKAAEELLDTDLPDRARYLKALVRAKDYLEGLMYDEAEEEE